MRAITVGLLTGTLMLTGSVFFSVAHAGILSTDKQRAKEELAIRLSKSAPVLEEKKKLQALFEADVRAKTPSGQATLKAAVDTLTLAASEYGANEDGDRPVVMWDTHPAHKWMGLDVPRSGYGLPNPDNVYRSIPLDGAVRYEIHGKITSPSALETLVLFSGLPGGSTMGTYSDKSPIMEEVELDAVDGARMDVNPDGTFTIAVDNDDANGRRNHLKTPPDNHHLHVVIRDSIADWATQNPIALDIVRLSGPPMKPAPKEADLEKRTAEILSSFGPFWLEWEHEFDSVQPNQITAPYPRRKGWGFTTVGHYNLKDDEAWIVTLDSLGGTYLGFAVDDPWGLAVESVTRQGSLTQAQAKSNGDGTYTYVISPKDPGVQNWLDTSSLTQGTFQIRWQGLSPSVMTAVNAVKSVQVVKLKDLKGALPAGMVFITPQERQAQLAVRVTEHNRRLD